MTKKDGSRVFAEDQAKKLMNDYPKYIRQKELGASLFNANGEVRKRVAAMNRRIHGPDEKIKSAVLTSEEQKISELTRKDVLNPVPSCHAGSALAPLGVVKSFRYG